MENIPVIVPKRNTLTILAKLEMLKEWASSGISARQFADLKGNINHSQLYKWKRNLAGIPQTTKLHNHPGPAVRRLQLEEKLVEFVQTEREQGNAISAKMLAVEACK